MISKLQIDNLRAGEEAYSDGVNVFTVRIVRIPSADPHSIVLELSGRHLGAEGETKLDFPAHRRTVHLAAIAPAPYGHTTPQLIIEELRAIALEKWPAYIAGVKAFDDIPLFNHFEE